MEIVVERTSGHAVVHLDGRFDVTCNLPFRQATKPLLAAGDVNTLVIDFSDVSFTDTSVLGSLILLREHAQGVGKEVVLTRCGTMLRRTLAIAQFNRLFRID